MSKDRSGYQIEKFDAVIIGNIARETVVDYLGNSIQREGGAIVYATSACISNGAKITVSTKLSKDDSDLLKPLHSRLVDVYFKYNGNTAVIKKDIPSFESKSAKTICLNQGSPFQICDIPDVDSYYYMFLNDFCGEISLDLIAYFSQYAKIALDVSCFVRRINPDTKQIEIFDYRHKKNLASLCDIFKATFKEAKFLTGANTAKEACKTIKSWGANEVLIVDDKILYLVDTNGKFYICPICELGHSYQLYSDTTAFAVYVTQRLTSDPDTSLYSAAAVSMINLQRPGPVKCTRAEINLNLDTYYYHRCTLIE